MDGQRFKAALKAAGIKQVRMAEILQVDPGTISRWVSGNREPGDADKVRIAEILNVSVDYLMGREDEHGLDQHNPHQKKVGFTDRPDPGEIMGVAPSFGDDLKKQLGPQASVKFVTREDVVMIPVISETGTFDSGMRFSLPIDEIPLMGPNVDVESLFAMRISDDVMTPYLAPGDYAVCRKSQEVKPGQLVVVTVEGLCCIRGIRRTASGDIRSLVVGNKAYPNMDVDDSTRTGLQVIGQVLRIFHASTAPGVLM